MAIEDKGCHMLTPFLQKSTGKLEAGGVWNHRMENAASNLTMVTEDCVKKHLKRKNKGFVKYVYNNARLMSDIFYHVHTSDISYSVI